MQIIDAESGGTDPDTMAGGKRMAVVSVLYPISRPHWFGHSAFPVSLKAWDI